MGIFWAGGRVKRGRNLPQSAQRTQREEVDRSDITARIGVGFGARYEGGRVAEETRERSAEERETSARRRKVMPVAELIGFELAEVGEGRSVVTLETGPQHTNPMGTTHGGILCDIADSAMGIAFHSTLSPGESFTTVELKINFFRPVWKAQLRAEGKVVRRGKSVGYVECEVSDENGRAIAKASSTCLVLRGAEAKGR
jgi:uncharacterized protein (TIGR00369 family)